MLRRLSLEPRILPVGPLPHPMVSFRARSSSEALLEVTRLVRGVDRQACVHVWRAWPPPTLPVARPCVTVPLQQGCPGTESAEFQPSLCTSAL